MYSRQDWDDRKFRRQRGRDTLPKENKFAHWREKSRGDFRAYSGSQQVRCHTARCTHCLVAAFWVWHGHRGLDTRRAAGIACTKMTNNALCPFHGTLATATSYASCTWPWGARRCMRWKVNLGFGFWVVFCGLSPMLGVRRFLVK